MVNGRDGSHIKAARAPTTKPSSISAVNIIAIAVSFISLAFAYFSSSNAASSFSLTTSAPFKNQDLQYTSSAMAANQTFKALQKAFEVRRSVYKLSPESTISNDEIKEILETALEQAPSTFGSFTTRLVLCVNEEHKKLWDTITEVIKGVTEPEKFEGYTKARLEGFRNAYGTVLFYEDPENTKALQEKFAFAADHFPTWAQHTSAIHQYMIWTSLANSGMGANLQHYNPIIDKKLAAQYSVPETWNLVAQLVFGKPTGPAGPKPTAMKKPLEERLFVHGA